MRSEAKRETDRVGALIALSVCPLPTERRRGMPHLEPMGHLDPKMSAVFRARICGVTPAIGGVTPWKIRRYRVEISA